MLWSCFFSYKKTFIYLELTLCLLLLSHVCCCLFSLSHRTNSLLIQLSPWKPSSSGSHFAESRTATIRNAASPSSWEFPVLNSIFWLTCINFVHTAGAQCYIFVHACDVYWSNPTSLYITPFPSQPPGITILYSNPLSKKLPHITENAVFFFLFLAYFT